MTKDEVKLLTDDEIQTLIYYDAKTRIAVSVVGYDHNSNMIKEMFEEGYFDHPAEGTSE